MRGSTMAMGLFACCGLAGIAQATPPVEAYGHLPSLELARLSPSGQRFAFVALVDGSRKLAVDSFEGRTLALNSLGPAKLRDIEWAGENHLLAITSATFDYPLAFDRPYELDSVIDISLEKKSAALVFGSDQDIAQTVLGYFGPAQSDGRQLAYFGGITLEPDGTGQYRFVHGYRDLYRVDLDKGSSSRVARGGEDDHHWLIGADGTMLAHSEYNQKSGVWQLYAGDGRGKLLLQKTSPTDDIDLVGQGRSPGTALVLDESGDEDVAEEISLADGKAEKLFDTVSVDRFLFDGESGRLIGAVTADEPGAMFFDPLLQARYNGTRKAFPGLAMRLESYSRNLQRLIVSTSGNGDSGTLWLVDIASGKANEVGHPYPEIGAADVGPVSTVHYKAADGTPIEAILTLPPGRKAEKLPLVVMPHGGPIGVRDRIGFDWWAQAYASAGYAVLQPNYRGSSGYGREFRQAGYGQWGGKMLSDISDGIAPLAAQGLIDPHRVCIVGGSYGGYAALAGVTLQHGLYRCAVAVAGVSDMRAHFDYVSRDEGGRNSEGRYVRAATGADQAGDGKLRDISPANFADKADAPVLLIHGTDDTVVPLEQSETMASALKHAGKPVELVKLKSEDHHLSREDTRIAMLKASLDFLKRYNPAD